MSQEIFKIVLIYGNWRCLRKKEGGFLLFPSKCLGLQKRKQQRGNREIQPAEKKKKIPARGGQGFRNEKKSGEKVREYNPQRRRSRLFQRMGNLPSLTAFKRPPSEKRQLKSATNTGAMSEGRGFII